MYVCFCLQNRNCLLLYFLHVHKSSRIIERMKIYAKYCNNYDAAEALYKQKLKKREFETFVNVSRHPLLLVLLALFLSGGGNVRRLEQPGWCRMVEKERCEDLGWEEACRVAANWEEWQRCNEALCAT